MSNNEAKSLIIKNLSMLETVKNVFDTEIAPKICEEICKLIKNWAEEQNFNGEYELWKDKYFWFYQENWKYIIEQEQDAWVADYTFIFVDKGEEIHIDDSDIYYFLSPFINVGPLRAGIKFSIERKAVKAGTLREWKKFVHGHKSYVELMKIGFEPIDSGNWFISWSLDSGSLANAYESENIADALNPILQVLDKIKIAHPIFEKLIYDAKKNFGPVI